MFDKEIAINILEEVKQDFIKDSTGSKAKRTIDMYIKGLNVATNLNIQRLVDKHKAYLEKYGEFDERTLNINQRAAKEIEKIYNQ